MSISFDPHRPLLLYASEVEALNIPIDVNSIHCLPLRIDLDGNGEIIRLGERRQLVEGSFNRKKRSVMMTNRHDHDRNTKSNSIDDTIPDDSISCLFLPCHVEIRSYLLDTNTELSSNQLMSRCIPIHVSKTAYDPHADLVLNDLDSIPAVIDAIDKGMIQVISAWMDR